MKNANAAMLSSYTAGASAGPDGAPVQFSFGHASRACDARRNEDFFGIVAPAGEAARAKGVLLAVADGVSGGGGGRIAAETTVRSLLSDYYATPETWQIPRALDKVLSAINSWLVTENRRHPELDGMVTTLSALVLRGGRYYLAHVGDARIYQMRDGGFELLTADHVWLRRTMQHVLRRAVGLDGHLVMDFAEGEVRAGDVFLLLSDGVWEVIGNDRVREIAKSCPDPQAAADALVDEAIRIQRGYLGHNDATAVVVGISSIT